MNDIVIPEITISHWELFVVFLTFFSLLMLILVVSTNMNKITPYLTNANILSWSAGGLAFLLFVPAVGQLVPIVWDPKASGLLQGDSRGYAVLLAAIVGAPLVVWRTVVAHMQSNTAAQGLITDRITKAVEQLGSEKTIQNIQDIQDKITNQSSATPIFNQAFNSGFNQGNDQKFQINDERYYSITKSVPNLEVRLGGIYALERIARDSLDDHITVMEILCAYVRNNSPVNRNRIPINWAEVESGALNNWRASVHSVRFDIQAIIDVIARRNQEQINRETLEEYQLDISYCNLQRVDFRKGNFDRALMNHNDMNMAKMKGVKLNQAHLEGAALNDAFLREAELNSANLMGAQLNKANLFMAQMNGTELFRAAFVDANTSLTAVRSTSFILTSGLTADNVNRMFGDNSTIPIERMEDRPVHWPTENLSTIEFLQRWTVHVNATQ